MHHIRCASRLPVKPCDARLCPSACGSVQWPFPCLRALHDSDPDTQELRRSLTWLRRLAVLELLEDCDVICATCIGAGSDSLAGLSFPFVVVDEAAQCTEPETLVPLVRGARHCVLAGDDAQLPPTVLSRAAARGGLGRSLFERLHAGGAPTALLTTQYRMHSALAAYPSRAFYGGVVGTARGLDAALPLPRPLGRRVTFVQVRGGGAQGQPRSVVEASPLCQGALGGRGQRRRFGSNAKALCCAVGVCATAAAIAISMALTTAKALVWALEGRGGGGRQGRQGWREREGGRWRERYGDGGGRVGGRRRETEGEWEGAGEGESDMGREDVREGERGQEREGSGQGPLLGSAGWGRGPAVFRRIVPQVWGPEEAVGDSYRNCSEAAEVVRCVRALEGAVALCDIGVLCPYAAQATHLRRLLSDCVCEGLEIKTVDAFQGQEKAVIVFSAVRSSRARTVGFLRDWRRLNVALTRAKRALVLFGDADTLRRCAHWRGLLAEIPPSASAFGRDLGAEHRHVRTPPLADPPAPAPVHVRVSPAPSVPTYMYGSTGALAPHYSYTSTPAPVRAPGPTHPRAPADPCVIEADCDGPTTHAQPRKRPLPQRSNTRGCSWQPQPQRGAHDPSRAAGSHYGPQPWSRPPDPPSGTRKSAYRVRGTGTQEEGPARAPCRPGAHAHGPPPLSSPAAAEFPLLDHFRRAAQPLP